MGLSDIPRAGVEKAVAEFDELGRDAFLEKYGFGRAQNYFLRIGDQLYDSKAIAGAAHGFAFPGRGPLKADEFSGGEQTVQKVLEGLGFTVATEAKRNPVWSRDELILALAFYLQHRDAVPDKASDAIAALSRDLNDVARLAGLSGDERFRNPNGVYMKLMNFRALDPEYTGQGRVGLERGGKGDAAVWAEFADGPDRLAATADAIRSVLATGTIPPADVEDEDPETAEATEGRALTRIHRYRERDRDIVERKKRSVLKAEGRLVCEACGFNFEKVYGERGGGFIECHHLKPLSELRGAGKTAMKDLALVCANCHRMIHARRPWLSMNELRALLSSARRP